MSLILLGILNSQAAAAGAAGAYDLLETQTLTGSAASVTFTGLGSYSDYKHLQIRAAVRSDTTFGGGTYDLVDYTFNGIGGTSYAYHSLFGTGSSVVSNGATSQAIIRGGSFSGSAAAANIFSPIVTDILDFSNSNKNTTVRILDGQLDGSLTRIHLSSGLLNNTTALSSITLDGAFGNFVTGSRFSLYGIKGA